MDAKVLDGPVQFQIDSNEFLRSLNQMRVQEFMERMRSEDQNVKPWPEIASERSAILRVKLMLEELIELARAMGVEMGKSPCGEWYVITESECRPNLVEIADGLADLEVVMLGTANAYGIALQPVFDEVMNNNMAKFGPGHTFREDGKLIKAPSHKPPDIHGVLMDQMPPGATDLP
jgi:predicted HAD superfamily Cof-like phosphohydrolase